MIMGGIATIGQERMMPNYMINDETTFLDEEFIRVMEEYAESSIALHDAAGLCNEDPIRQDMIAFVYPEFESARARHEGIMTLAVDSYSDNREFILEEMKRVSKQNFKIAEQISNKLKEL